MKKIIILFLALLSFVSVSFGLTLTGSDITGDTIVLDEGENTIWKKTGYSTKVEFETGHNVFLTNNIRNSSSEGITIICKNGYIVKIKGNQTWTGEVESAKLSYDYKSSEHKYKNSVPFVCQPITKPSKKLSENKLDINYQTISTNPATFENYNITNSTNPELTGSDIKNKLSAGKDKNTQPTFVNILYLQLKTISNLSDSMIEENPNLKFSDLFQDTNDKNYNFTGYNIWLNKFEKYQTKKDFQDAFSGAITLKDIGIAQDVIAGIYDCTENKQCKHSIVFHHKLLDKYDTYSLDEIEKQLYGHNNSIPAAPVHKPGNPKQDILTYSINYYSRLEKECDSNNINDNFLKNQITNICNKLKSTQVDQNNPEKFNLGYSLGIRVKNLQNIADNIPTSGLNLKGVFNIYWELNNLTLGTNKIEVIKKVKEETNVDKQYEIFKKILKKEAEEIKDGAIGNNIGVNSENYRKIKAIESIIKHSISSLLEQVDITNYSNFQFIGNQNTNILQYKLDDNTIITIKKRDFIQVGYNNYNKPNNLNILTGNYISNSINSKCFPKVSNNDPYFENNCDSSNQQTGKIGSLNYVFTGNNIPYKFSIGTQTGIFLDNKEKDDKLFYKDMSLGSGFKIEVNIRGGALKRKTGIYYLFRQPFGKKMFLKLENGELILGASNTPTISISKRELETLNNDKYYTISAFIKNDGWKLNIKNETNEEKIEKKCNYNIEYITPINVKRLSIGANLDNTCNITNYDNGSCSTKNHWNDIINYIKIYKGKLETLGE